MTETPAARSGLFDEHRRHVPFIAGALALAVIGGFALAILIPLEVAARGPTGVRGIALAQVHGHLQTVGFVGLFIVGVAYHVLPGFTGRPLAAGRLVPASFWLLGGGVLLRAVMQPLGAQPLPAALLALAAWMELAGAAIFALILTRTAGPGVRGGRVFAPFLIAGAWWLLAQALLGAVWLSDLAQESGRVLPFPRNAVLVSLQFFGFHLSFIMGVALRTFPIFFGARRPSLRLSLVAFVPMQLGVALLLAGRIPLATGRADAWLLQDAAFVILGGGLLAAAWLTGAWRAPARVRPISRPFARMLQASMLWLVLAALLMIAFAIDAAGQSSAIGPGRLDAIRHIVGVGVVLSAIVGMAQLILPEFASERLAGRQGIWRGFVLGGALSLAAALRAGAALFADALPGRTEQLVMALAGTIALVVIVAFAALVARSMRIHAATLASFSLPAGGRRD